MNFLARLHAALPRSTRFELYDVDASIALALAAVRLSLPKEHIAEADFHKFATAGAACAQPALHNAEGYFSRDAIGSTAAAVTQRRGRIHASRANRAVLVWLCPTLLQLRHRELHVQLLVRSRQVKFERSGALYRR